MEALLDMREELLLLVPSLREDQLKQISRKYAAIRQRFLMKLLDASYRRRRPHRDAWGADSFSQDYLRGGLRAGLDVYKRILAQFYDFPMEGHSYSKDLGLTKPYLLKPEIREALHRVYTSDRPARIISQDEGLPFDVRIGPDVNGVPEDLGSSLFIPSLVPLPLQAVDRAIEQMKEWVAEIGPDAPLDRRKRNGMGLAEALQVLEVAKKWQVSVKGLPNIYALHANGRLGPSGFHLIEFPNMVRKLLLTGSELWDYDLASCHWSIFCSLGPALGFSTERATIYTRQKSRCHSRWAGITRHSHRDDFKQVALSWLTGGRLNAHSRTTTAKLLGIKGAEILAQDSVARGLYSEIQDGMKQVVRALHREGDGRHQVFINAVGATLESRDAFPRFGQLCSHALTGFEQFAMRAMCKRASGLIAMVYDGFIAPEQDTGQLEDHVRESSSKELGFDLAMSLKGDSFSDPIEPPEADPDDF